MKMFFALLAVAMAAACSAGPSGSEKGNYSQVTGPCNLSFPADHGPHPGYRTEWWYYTGNLADADRHRYGFQLTFFRFRLEPPAGRKDWPEPASAWRTDQVYMAHAALTDITGERHLQAERMSRPVLSLAGAEQKDSHWKIYLDTWAADIAPHQHRLQADADDFAFALDLTSDKPPVLHGDDGYSRKGQAPERASCYYSFTRLTTDGTVTLNGKRHAVRGTAWMDHEFSTSPLQPGVIGWDWFSLQLSDQTELMVYLLREKDGRLNPASSGTYIRASAQTRHLRHNEVKIEPLAFWTSPHTGARYPVKWRLSIPDLDCSLEITAACNDQEMRTSSGAKIVYWEGAVQIQGTKGDKTVKGVGYVELTGYAGPFDAPL